MAELFEQPEKYCGKCGELIPETFKDKRGRNTPLLACMACLPLAPTEVAPRKRAPRPGIGSLLDGVDPIFIGRNG